MSVDGLRLRHLPHRNRLEMRIGALFTELTAEQAHALCQQLALTVRDMQATGLPGPRMQQRSIAARVLEQLEMAASAGLPCPTNRAIAERLGVARPDRISEVLAELKARGRIAVRQEGAARQVRLLPDGPETAAPRWKREA